MAKNWGKKGKIYFSQSKLKWNENNKSREYLF